MKNTKRFLLGTILGMILISSLGCGMRKKLLILNWGEYINEDVVSKFEKQTGYEVVISLAESNELFYSRVKSGTTVYDLVVPSDYMIEKMIGKKLLHEIDITKLKNHPDNNNSIHFMAGATGIQKDMFHQQGEQYKNYAIPYFWGTFGLMYNKNKPGLAEAVETHGWKAYFDASLRPAGTKVGMYNVPRYAYAASMFYLGEDPNEISQESLKKSSEVLSKTGVHEWGTDTLKKGVSSGNLDLAFVYTGDFLDMLYTKLDDGYSLDQITFDIHVPTETIAFMDALVIPKNARHKDIAYEFIDFMLDPQNAYDNASVVGYATPIQEAYDRITTYETTPNEIDPDDAWLSAWAYANRKYYPLPNEGDLKQYKGTPLANFDKSWLDRLNTMLNNVKVK